jgi:hypothetical protein
VPESRSCFICDVVRRIYDSRQIHALILAADDADKKSGFYPCSSAALIINYQQDQPATRR